MFETPDKLTQQKEQAKQEAYNNYHQRVNNSLNAKIPPPPLITYSSTSGDIVNAITAISKLNMTNALFGEIVKKLIQNYE